MEWKSRGFYCSLNHSTHKMWKKLGNILSPSSGHQPDLAWSLQPLFSTMSLLGVNLNMSPLCPSSNRRIITALSLMSLIFMEVSQFIHIFLHHSSSELDFQSIGDWMRLLKFYQWRVWSTLFPISTLYAVAFKWKLLLQETEKMQEFVNCSVFQRLRMISVASVVFGIVMVDTLKTFIIPEAQNEFTKWKIVYRKCPGIYCVASIRRRYKCW